MRASLIQGISTLFIAAALTGCVSTGSVTPTQPLAAPLAADKGWVVVSADAPAGETYKERVKLEIDYVLKHAGLVSANEKGGLTIDVKVVAFDTGDKVARYMNVGGEAEITLEVSITDAEGKKLTQVTVVGNSARQVERVVGGVRTSVTDNLVVRAIVAAAEELAEYLKKPSAEG